MATPIPYVDRASSDSTWIVYSDNGAPLAFTNPTTRELHAVNPENAIAVSAEIKYRNVNPAHAERAYLPQQSGPVEPTQCPTTCGQRFVDDEIWLRSFKS